MSSSEFTRPLTGKQLANVASGLTPDTGEGGGPPRILGESHVGLRVRDLDSSVLFYTQVLGFHEHHRSPGRQVILTCGRWCMALYSSARRESVVEVSKPYEVDRAGLHHLAFALATARDVGAAAEWLDQNSVRRKPVKEGYTPGSTFVTFYDPDGIPLEYYCMDVVYADVYGVQA